LHNERIICLTQSRRALGNYIKYRLDVRRRAGDDAEYLARRGLLLQCLGEFAP
jgi:hypothetical protein